MTRMEQPGSDLDELLDISITSMDFDPSSLEGEVQLQAYMQVQQVSNDTDPLMWCKQHQQEFPDLARRARQYLTLLRLLRDSSVVWDLYSLTDQYIEVLSHLQHLIPCSTLPTINHVD